MEQNFSYKKPSLIAEEIRHKSEITFENIFCWNIKEGFDPEHKMAIKEETDEQDMSKGQQKRPSLTGAVLFHCTQIWRRTSSPVLLLGEWLPCLVHKERDLLGNKRKSPRDSIHSGRNSQSMETFCCHSQFQWLRIKDDFGIFWQVIKHCVLPGDTHTVI